LWNYTWRTGLDEHGDPVPGACTVTVVPTGPRSASSSPTTPSHEHFGQRSRRSRRAKCFTTTFTGRAKTNNVRQFIQFDTAVRWISYDEKAGKFAVTVQTRDDGRTRTEEFDKVTRRDRALLHAEQCRRRGFDHFPAASCTPTTSGTPGNSSASAASHRQ